MFTSKPQDETETETDLSSTSDTSLPEGNKRHRVRGRRPQSIAEEIEQLWVFPVFIASVAALALSYDEVTRTVLYLTEKGGAREGNRSLLKLSAIMVRTKEEQVLPPLTVSPP